MAISPDGRTIVAGGPEDHLWARRTDDTEFRRIEGTDSARNPAVSPDGEWVAFELGPGLYRVQIGGGPVLPIVPDGGNPHWFADDEILYRANGRVWRVSTAGGTPTALAVEAGGRPFLLPGERGVLGDGPEGLYVTDLESGWTMQAIETGPDHLFEGLQGVMGVEIQSTFFGNALAVSPDLNGDYTNDVVVGLQGQTNPTGGDSFDGAVFILHLRPAAGVSMKLQ